MIQGLKLSGQVEVGDSFQEEGMYMDSEVERMVRGLHGTQIGR